MQKLITIHLSADSKHGAVEEHLENYLADGWNIQHVTALGGVRVEGGAEGWAVVVIRKKTDEFDEFESIPF